MGTIWLRRPKDEWMPGEAIKFQGDHRPWRILEITRDRLRLVFDSRSNPKFRFEKKADLSFSQRYWLRWPVYSTLSLAKAIRHTEFAPGDLYLDHRFLHSAVRPLSGREKWRITGLREEKADKLEAQGRASYLGPLAGNSIPSIMSNAVPESEADRVRRYKLLLDCRQKRTFTLMPPVAGLYNKALAATFLIFVGLASTDVLVWNGSELPGLVHCVD